MKITFLGTGTSDGVPMIGCKCRSCKSKDKKDKRTRSSVIITENNKNYIIDTSLDFRYQMLREKIDHLDVVFFTHAHADHTSGIVDLRSVNFAMNGKTINCYGNEETMNTLKEKYDFFFNPLQIGGGLPQVEFHNIKGKLKFDNITITPIPIKHGVLNIFGYRFNNFTYITDSSFISDESFKLIEGSEILVLNALRYRPHCTHFSIQEAVDIAEKTGIKEIYFTHMTHDILHKKLEKELPNNMHPAYDGLKLYL